MSRISSPRVRTALSCALLVAPLAISATACSDGDDPLSAKPYDAADQISVHGAEEGGKADPDKPLEVTAEGEDGRITDVTATDAAGRHIRGELTADGRRWRSTSPLAAGAHYTVRISTENGDGEPGRRTLGFDTRPANGSLRVSFGPDPGTYGVGQPLTAELSRPVKSSAGRKVVERALKVESQPRTEGSWHWTDDKTLHYRPRDYWPARATIEARSNLAGLQVEKNVHGGPSKPLRLRTGDRVEALTDAATHRMTVRRNGEVVRTIPVTTGKPGYDTRNGIKTILAKEAAVRMTSASIGSSDFYDLNVSWAARVTWSGEYLHAAPWSTGSQGSANVSHGCTGMSTENAKWFFDTVRVGDLVEVVNSEGETMTPFDNGFGDWNLSWAEWRKGSALSGGGSRPDAAPAERARLRPAV